MPQSSVTQEIPLVPVLSKDTLTNEEHQALVYGALLHGKYLSHLIGKS